MKFDELEKKVQSFIDVLKSYPLEQGDRVALLLPTSYETIALLLALYQKKVTVAFLNRYTPLEQIEEKLKAIDAKLYISSLASKPLLRKPLYPPMQEEGHLFFTSGSTGKPKIAFLTQSALMANSLSATHALSLNEKDHLLLHLPFYHVAGLGSLLRAFVAKASFTLDPMDSHITHFSAVPTQILKGMKTTSHLRSILVGGSLIPNLPKELPLFFSYGLTEMGSLIAIATQTSPYHPLPGKKIAIAEDNEILVQGDSLFSGYFHEGKLTLPLDPKGFFSTKDLARKEKDDGFFISGRKDFQFISGGENIQPEEIEEKLLQIEGIQEALVIGKEDPLFGKIPIAILVGKKYSKEDLQSLLQKRIEKFKIPKEFIYTSSLPKNGLKIDRKNLSLILSPKSQILN